MAHLYPWALGSLYVASYNSQGYGRGILILLQPGQPGSRVYVLQEPDGPVRSLSHVINDGHSISMPYQ
jgi:hypothetical protein